MRVQAVNSIGAIGISAVSDSGAEPSLFVLTSTGYVYSYQENSSGVFVGTLVVQLTNATEISAASASTVGVEVVILASGNVYGYAQP